VPRKIWQLWYTLGRLHAIIAIVHSTVSPSYDLIKTGIAWKLRTRAEVVRPETKIIKNFYFVYFAGKKIIKNGDRPSFADRLPAVLRLREMLAQAGKISARCRH
jgi:hypothetical protein